jgi:DNA-binding beta-propeller fold protein YncE
VFDLKTNQVITQIPTGQNPDAIMYEPFTKKIITCNGRSQSLSILDPIENKLVDSIPVGGKPETAVSDGAGKVFVNIEDKSEIVEVDMKTLKVTNHWSIKPGDGPTGLSIDTKTNRLFAGCGNKKMVVVNAQTGAIVDTLPIGSRCDGTGIDINTRNVFASNGDGTLSVYHIVAADKFELVAQVPTKTGARTIAVNDQKHMIYLPTAEFQQQAQNSGGRPQMIPGTFQILVVGQ